MAATIKRKNKRARNADASTNSIQSKAKIDPLVQHLGIGIDTGRYGHHVSFLREDKQQAALPMTVMEKAVDYQKLKTRLEQLHQRFPNAHLHLRIDAAGQYADNIEAFLRKPSYLPMTISVGQPKTNKDYHSVSRGRREPIDHFISRCRRLPCNALLCGFNWE